MELEIYIAGIGGQGVQLMAKIFAHAALAENRHVLLSAEYGFTMRGGSSLATVVIGAEPLIGLPVVATAGAAIFLHHEYLETPVTRLRPGALVITEETITEMLPPLPRQHVVPVAAARIAHEIGDPMTAGLVLLSSFCAMTELVRTDSLVDAMNRLVPSYRQQHIQMNEAAIRTGATCTPMQYPVSLDRGRLTSAVA